MRVIAGTARSLPLQTVAGTETRPTTDRVKETLFNILNPQLPGCRFLDLYAGSGAIGIEALSRGAREAVFVERSSAAVSCIRKNLEFTHLAERAQVMQADVLACVRQLQRGCEKTGAYDIIFMDPPYHQDLERLTCALLADSSLMDDHTSVIVEIPLRTDCVWADEMGLCVTREKKYKTNKHVWLRQK